MCNTDPTLRSVTHVVLDEVHERSIESDLLLTVLRDLLVTVRPDLRMVLMSASMNAGHFAAYFGGAPVLEIPGFTHPVQDLFLEDIVERTQFRLEQIPRKPKYAFGWGRAATAAALWHAHGVLEGTPTWAFRGGGGRSWVSNDVEKSIMAPYLQAGYSAHTAQTLAYFARRLALDPEESVAAEGAVDDGAALAAPLPRPPPTLDPELDVICAVVLELVVARHETGAVLIFLPGASEIRCAEHTRCARHAIHHADRRPQLGGGGGGGAANWRADDAWNGCSASGPPTPRSSRGFCRFMRS